LDYAALIAERARARGLPIGLCSDCTATATDMWPVRLGDVTPFFVRSTQ
jgi:hypothetical protein